uniref:Putative secreted protein n=1 Tax=Anopheles darlingi TaxID=43151 RepID=A0A2M4DD48_ANODA
MWAPHWYGALGTTVPVLSAHENIALSPCGKAMREHCLYVCVCVLTNVYVCPCALVDFSQTSNWRHRHLTNPPQWWCVVNSNSVR